MEIPLWEAKNRNSANSSAAQLYSHLSASRAVRSAVSSWLGDTMSRRGSLIKTFQNVGSLTPHGPWSIFIPDGLGISIFIIIYNHNPICNQLISWVWFLAKLVLANITSNIIELMSQWGFFPAALLWHSSAEDSKGKRICMDSRGLSLRGNSKIYNMKYSVHLSLVPWVD